MIRWFPFAFITAAVAALCWWFSLYILTLYPRSPLARSIGVAVALLSGMCLGEVMVMTAVTTRPFILGWRIVSVVGSFLPVLWLQINVLLLPQNRIVWPSRLVRLGWLLGTTFALSGVFTNSIFDYASLVPLSGSWKSFHLLPGLLSVPWHIYLSVYTVFTVCLSPYLFQAHDSLTDYQKRRLRSFILLAALAFAGTALYTFVEAALWVRGIELPVFGVQALYGVGVGALVVAALRYALFAPGRRLVRTSAYSLVATFGLAFLYGGVLLAIQGPENTSPLTLFLLGGLVVFTHMLFDLGRAVLDPLFFDDAVALVRRDLRGATQEVALAPDLGNALEQIEIRLSKGRSVEIIRDALSSQGDPAVLAGYARQLQLTVVEQRVSKMKVQKRSLGAEERGQALWLLLQEAIESLRPSGEQQVKTQAWRQYLALRRGYIEKKPDHEVSRELKMGLHALARIRSAGVAAVAEAVWQMERKIRSEIT